MTARKPPPLPPARLTPPDPKFRAALLKVFEGHPLHAAVMSGQFALGLIDRDRGAAEMTLREMEADPAKFRARFGGGTA